MNPRRIYGRAAAVVLAIEIGIAVFVDDALIRPYFGDALAVVLVYLGARWLLPLRPVTAAAGALALAVAIELAQYFHMLAVLGLEHNRLARTILGGVFDPVDLVAYASGAAAALIVERVRGERL
ncbi:DUF2809 domain-containing protein [Caulobacter sp. HMWF009]|nr:DUF2809 domain-containing protein [Caulobacter sp. HMWF009]PTT11352.1 DUF2809 domain-containing protein [Caulobacter sp. HMWF025]